MTRLDGAQTLNPKLSAGPDTFLPRILPNTPQNQWWLHRPAAAGLAAGLGFKSYRSPIDAPRPTPRAARLIRSACALRPSLNRAAPLIRSACAMRPPLIHSASRT